jgi:D-hydroxyproline dehydrogenase subunit gamma
MFRTLRDEGEPGVTLSLDGVPCVVPRGASVAAALLLLGAFARTTGNSGSTRAPYCMMGVCHDCLVEIDGEPNRQACMVEAEEGMQVRRQIGDRAAGAGP